jgi:hypothetical protein
MDSTSLVWGYSFQQSFPLVGHTLNTILGNNKNDKKRKTKKRN